MHFRPIYTHLSRPILELIFDTRPPHGRVIGLPTVMDINSWHVTVVHFFLIRTRSSWASIVPCFDCSYIFSDTYLKSPQPSKNNYKNAFENIENIFYISFYMTVVSFRFISTTYGKSEPRCWFLLRKIKKKCIDKWNTVHWPLSEENIFDGQSHLLSRSSCLSVRVSVCPSVTKSCKCFFREI